MDRATTNAVNGGFPLPAAGQPQRLVRVRHEACGTETRVRLPRPVPALAVRRVVCEHCAAPYEATAGAATEAEIPPRGGAPISRTAAGRMRFPRLPGAGAAVGRETILRWAGLPLAAVAVLLALNAIQGGDGSEPSRTDGARETRGAVAGAPGADAPRVVDTTGRDGAPAKPDDDAQIVSESTYTLALPAGWDRVSAQGGATFAAVAPGGDADATLWVEQDPKLDFASFEARSLEQLEQLAGSAEVVERTTGPTPESTVVRIAADAPEGAPRYEALLRAGPGPEPYWYYLATTVQPDAPAEAIEGVELLQGSLVPEGAK